MSPVLATENCPAIFLEDAIKVSNPEVVAALVYKLEPVDSNKKGYLLDLAQNIIVLRQDVITALRKKTTSLPDQDKPEFNEYYKKHVGFFSCMFRHLYSLVGTGCFLGGTLSLGGLVFFKLLRNDVNFLNILLFAGLPACGASAWFGLYLRNKAKKATLKIKLEFLQQKYEEALLVKYLISKVQVAH